LALLSYFPELFRNSSASSIGSLNYLLSFSKAGGSLRTDFIFFLLLDSGRSPVSSLFRVFSMTVLSLVLFPNMFEVSDSIFFLLGGLFSGFSGLLLCLTFLFFAGDLEILDFLIS
jgi:hypothetical protein